MNTTSITYKETYIEVISKGSKNLESATHLWKKIVATCQEHDCYKILGLAQSENRFSTSDTHAHAEMFRSLGIDKKYKIAWAETNQDALQQFNVMESILQSYGFINTQVFDNPINAKNWLLNDDT